MPESATIRLQATQKENIDQILEMERDPENVPFIRQWTREQHDKSISDGHYGHFTIRGHGSKIIGYVIFAGLDNPDQSIEFKRIVLRNKGTGLGRQAVELIKKKAFDDLGAHRLWLEVMQDNLRARHVYTSCGFIMEGVHRESLKTEDRFVSLDVMSILEHEYRQPANPDSITRT